MKVFTSEEIKFLEQCTAEKGLTLYELMEKAGSAVAAFIKKQGELKGKAVVILCGKGNNGGDGFVCARRLFKMGANVSVVLAEGNPKSTLAQTAFETLDEKMGVHDWTGNKYEIETAIEKADIVVDAVFGFGFKGAVSGVVERLITKANKSRALKIAVDLPSGAECDTGKVEGTCFRADFTVALTSVKPANVLHPAAAYCGRNVIAPIGIDKGLIESLPCSFSVINEENITSVLKKRNPQSNKGSFGRLLMICGSYGMVGAAIMAAKGALRSGVGLLNLVVSKECYPLIAPSVPEAVFTVVDFSNEEETKRSGEALFTALNKATACVIGCGLGDEAQRYVSTVLKFSPCPVILDADGLNYLAANMGELVGVKAPLIVTPHPGEMARLTGKTVLQIQIDRITAAKRFSAEFKVITVLKGAGTLVATPDGEIRLNTTGNAGMAKGGSGDVLAGIIGSLAAQGISPVNAAVAGVYIHGKAGDLCADKLSKISALPTDLIEELPRVFKKLEEIIYR